MVWSRRYELQVWSSTRQINGEPATFAIVHQFSEGESEYIAGRIVDKLPASVEWVGVARVFGSVQQAQDFCEGLDV